MRVVFIPFMLSLALVAGCSDTNHSPGDVGNRDAGTGDGGTQDDSGLSTLDDYIDNSIKGPPKIDMAAYRLVIKGLVDSPREYTFDEVVKNFPLHEKVFELNCVEGWSVTYRWGGVMLNDLFDAAKARMDSPVVILTAVDGYSTSLPLEYLHDKNIMLAYKVNGDYIPPKVGYPFILAAEGKWGYKWIKWVATVELSNDVNYRGYWESHGYSNDGDLDKPFFDIGGE